MFKPFDTTTREMFDGYAGPLMDYLGLVLDGPIRVVDSNVSTVLAEVDKLYQVDGPDPYLIHVEFQASASAPCRSVCYDTMSSWTSATSCGC